MRNGILQSTPLASHKSSRGIRSRTRAVEKPPNREKLPHSCDVDCEERHTSGATIGEGAKVMRLVCMCHHKKCKLSPPQVVSTPPIVCFLRALRSRLRICVCDTPFYLPRFGLHNGRVSQRQESCKCLSLSLLPLFWSNRWEETWTFACAGRPPRNCWGA